MKKFIIKLLIFLLPFFVLLFIIEVSIRHIPNDYKSKRDYIKKNGKNIEILALGSSHVYYGLNPDFFNKSCFNLAQVAQTPEFDLKLFQHFLPQLPHLKVLIYPISYFTFYWDLQSSTESWRLKNYSIYYKINTSQSLQNYFEIFSVDPKSNYKRIINFYKHKKTEVGVTPRGWGFNCLAEYSANLDQTAAESAIRHTNVDGPFYSKNSSEVEEIIKICQQKGIQVVLLFPPAYKAYRDQINKKQLNNTYLKVDSLVVKYSNCRFIDIFADTNYVAQDFLDADHLNNLGSKKMSQFLNDYIQQTYFRK